MMTLIDICRGGGAKIAFMALVSLGAAMLSHAETYYVDASASVDGADGTAERPFPTIQAAVNAAADGDTVRIAEGVYSEGATVVDEGSASKSVVSIVDKKLHLIGAGRGKTIITGSRNPNAGNAYSESVSQSATRCVLVRDSDGTVIEKVTLRDGETCTNGVSKVEKFNAGGGLYANSKEVYLVDSEIVHCAALYGASMYQGTAIRCLIDGNFGRMGLGGHTSRLVNCVVTRSVPEGGSTGTMYKSELYNCTLVDNATVWPIQHKEDKVYNSLLLLSAYTLNYRETNVVETLVADSVLPSQASKGNMQLMGPAVGDWRLLPDSDALGAGDPSHLEALELPESIDPMLDFNGEKIESDVNGRINAGAVQSVGVPAAGALWFEGIVEVNGRESCNAKAAVYVYPSVYPTQYCVRAAAKDRDNAFRLTRYDFSGKTNPEYPSILPQRDGCMWLMTPADVSLVSTNEIKVASVVLHVDANKGSDNWGGDVSDAGSEDHPYASIQAAVAAATSDYTLVKVHPGDYNTGSSVSDSKGAFRVYVSEKKICIRSVSGPEHTKIWGAADGDTKGLGPKAVKCVYLKGRDAYLQGFTLTDGYTAGDEAVNDDMQTGAAIHSVPKSSPYSAVVADCIITNCHAYKACILSSTLHRSRIFDCHSADGVIADDTLLWGCYFRDCVDSEYGLINGVAYQSTFVGKVNEGRIGNSKETSCNCIWDGGANVYSTSVFTNSITWNIRGYNGNPTAWTKINPLFVSREEDGTLCRNSPAVGMGCNLWDSGYGDGFWTLAGGDINGHPLVFTEGCPTVGAFQRVSDLVAVSAAEPAQGGWAFADGAAFGEALVDESESLTVVPADGTRPCIGVSCGGRDFLFTNSPNDKIVFDYSVLAGMKGIVTIEGIYSTDWYVDDNGDDSNTGFLPTHPKKTLSKAASLLESGDTLWVFPGTYDQGGAIGSSGTLTNRVVLKSGVSVISTEGPERTIIVGSSATKDPDEHGCGTNAVRCAFVAKNARLSGFTLTGGRVNLSGATGADKSGSAVCGQGRSQNCVVDNCIISNNVASNGTVYKADVFDSLVSLNHAVGQGSGVREGNAYNCCFTCNTGSPVISYPQYIIGCTIADDNLRDTGATASFTGNIINDSRICNSLFMGDNDFSLGANDYGYISNIVCGIGSTFNKKNDNATTGNVYLVDFSTQSFYGGVVPVAGANGAVDAADESLCTNLYSGVDLRGFQRVMNGRRDIGAYEADWRGVYGMTLFPNANLFVVESASRDVALVDGVVTIPSGKLEATWRNSTGRNVLYVMPVRVVGNGELSVMLDGVVLGVVRKSDGDISLSFISKEEHCSVSFAYEPGEGDAGCAVLGSFARSRMNGLIFTVR